MKFTIDKKGKVEKLYKKVIDMYFPKLSVLEFIFVWRDKEKYNEGQLVVAETTKLSNRDRDLFGFDVRIETDEDNWPLLSENDKIKIAFHELSHIQLEYNKKKDNIDEDDESDEDSEDNEIEDVSAQNIKYDKEGRVSFHLKNHDLILKRFEAELWEFGLSRDEKNMLNLLNKVKKYHKEKQEEQENQELEEQKPKKKKKKKKKKSTKEE